MYFFAASGSPAFIAASNLSMYIFMRVCEAEISDRKLLPPAAICLRSALHVIILGLGTDGQLVMQI